MSKSLFLKMSALTLVVVVMIMASLVAGDLLVRTFAAPQGMIVQLQRDPVIVAKTAAEARGQNFVTAPSNSATVLVDHRTKVDITSQVSMAMSSASFSGGVFRMDYHITNNSASTYVPIVDMNIIGITSPSGTVTAKNAVNGGNGKSIATAALFNYSDLLGADQQFTANEVTGDRRLEFNNSAGEMFSIDVNVTAYVSGASGGGGGEGAAPAGGDAGGSGSSGTGPLSAPKVMRITVNPLTKSVTAKLL